MRTLLRFLKFAIALAAVLSTGCSERVNAPAQETGQAPPAAANQPLVVYAGMPAPRLLPVLEAYTAETGDKVELLTGDGEISYDDVASLPDADLYVGTGLAALWQVAELDGFRPTYSDVVAKNIPAILRDQEMRWTALATHSAVIVYNTDLVSGEMLERVEAYAALGEPAWKGKLCLSSSDVAGNRTLIAFLIQQHDVREAEIVVRNWRANLATNVFDSDEQLIHAISSGQCAIGIARSNAFFEFGFDSPGAPVAVHTFSNPASVVVDASGAGVMRHADNPELAQKFLAWLTMKSANALYASLGEEFPANRESPLSAKIVSLEASISAPASLTGLGFLQEDAALLADRARYP